MDSSGLFLVGVNHLTAPVACRERTAVLAGELRETLIHLMGLADLREAVVLSTCSRVEIIATARDPESAASSLKNWLVSRAGAEAEAAVYVHREADAVRHLFRVTAGLDSWIIGESEIQGQVKRAYQLAFELKATGRVLNRVFQRAVNAGKSIRTQTGIQDGIHSIGGAAALLARKIFNDAERGRIVVFGAGEAAEAVARHLAAKNFRQIWVANRTVERARAVAAPLGGEAVSFDEGIKKLAETEAAVFSTACPKPLLEAATLRPLLTGRKRPLFLIDLGMPRNVESACGRIPEVYLYNLDDLKEIVRGSAAKKSAGKERAEVLVSSAAEECVEGLRRSDAMQAVLLSPGGVP